MFVLVGGLCVFAVSNRPSAAETLVAPQQSLTAVANDEGLCAAQTNLLQNPSFEGDYEIYNPSGGHS